jgi:hypothetical protein
MNANLQKAALGIGFGMLIAALPAETAWTACFEDVGCTNNQYMSINQLRQLLSEPVNRAQHDLLRKQILFRDRRGQGPVLKSELRLS